MNCELKFCARQQYQHSYDIQSHTHPCYELVYYLSGSGTTTIGKNSYNFSENTFCFSRPNEIHSEKSNDAALVVFVGFTVDRELPKESFFADKSEAVKKILLEIEEELKNKQTYYRGVVDILAQKLVYHILRFIKSDEQEENNFKYILNYIESSATQQISIKQIAYNLGYNYDYLRQMFLKWTGKTAKDYLIDIKLKHVKNYLINFDYSLEDISNLTGFSSASHLCMAFKREFNISPLDFRHLEKKNRQVDNFKVKI